MTEHQHPLPRSALLARVESLGVIFLGGLLFAAVALIVVDVILRYSMNIAPLHSFELTQYFFGVFCAFSFALSMLGSPHVRITVFVGRAGPGVTRVLSALAALSMLYVAIQFALGALGVLLQTISLDATSNSTLEVPMWIPQAAWFAGNLLFVLLALRAAWWEVARR